MAEIIRCDQCENVVSNFSVWPCARKQACKRLTWAIQIFIHDNIWHEPFRVSFMVTFGMSCSDFHSWWHLAWAIQNFVYDDIVSAFVHESTFWLFTLVPASFLANFDSLSYALLTHTVYYNNKIRQNPMHGSWTFISHTHTHIDTHATHAHMRACNACVHVHTHACAHTHTHTHTHTYTHTHIHTAVQNFIMIYM